MSSGMIIGPGMSGGAVVARPSIDGHFESANPMAAIQPTAPIAAPKYIGYNESGGVVILPSPNQNGRNEQLVSWLDTLLVIAATGLSLADAYFLFVALECLALREDIKVLVLALAGIAVGLGVLGNTVKLCLKPEDDAEQPFDGLLDVQKHTKHNCVRYCGQLAEDSSVLISLLPTLVNLLLKKADIIAKAIAVIAFASSVLTLIWGPRRHYPCRKVVSLALVIFSALMFFLTFFNLENSKSLVVYDIVDTRTNETIVLPRQEDQISYDGTKYCVILGTNPCIPCFLTAVHGRGVNTWTPKRNDTGQCAGVSITVDEAFDCTEFGTRIPISVSIFIEDTCAVQNGTIECFESTASGL